MARAEEPEGEGEGREAGFIANHGGDSETVAGEREEAAALTGGRRVGGIEIRCGGGERDRAPTH